MGEHKEEPYGWGVRGQGCPPASSPFLLHRSVILCAQPLRLLGATWVPLSYNIVTAAPDAASGAPLAPGLGTRRCAGTFFPRGAIFRVLQLNCCWELYIFSRKVCVINEAAGVRVLGGADAVPNGMGICWPLFGRCHGGLAYYISLDTVEVVSPGVRFKPSSLGFAT